MKLIIYADDFGYSNVVNYGIIDAFKNGILTSTTCLTNMPGFNHAIQLAKENPNLGIGIHLTLTCGKPLTHNLYTLVDSDGNFRDLSHYEQKFYIDTNELYNEWKEQIEKFLETGITPTHMDTHHHGNNLGDKKNYPNYKMVDYFEYHPETILNPIEIIREKYQLYKTVEIMCHPAYIDKFLRDHSSFVMPRIEELDLLTSEHAKSTFNKANGITLINYSQL